MDANLVLQMATGMMATYAEAMSSRTLSEYEMLAYEQACRAYEVIMRDFRNMWEKQHNELRENKD